MSINCERKLSVGFPRKGPLPKIQFKLDWSLSVNPKT